MFLSHHICIKVATDFSGYHICIKLVAILLTVGPATKDLAEAQQKVLDVSDIPLDASAGQRRAETVRPKRPRVALDLLHFLPKELEAEICSS